MLRIDPLIDKHFSENLLDIYFERTGLPVAFYMANSGGAIYSEKNWPPFCQEICKLIGPKACECPTHAIKGLYQCYIGLWCYAQPVEIDGKVVGTFVVGHRRIRGREEESKKVLEQKLSENNVNDEDSNRLRRLLKKVDAVDEDAFNINLLEKLSFIEQYVIIEHKHATTEHERATTEHERAITEHEHAIAFKAEATSLAHEFLLPIQSIIADAENLFNESEERSSELKNIAEDVLLQVTKLSFIAENIRGSVLEERDKFGYEFHDVDIYPIVQDTINLFRKEAKKKGVALSNPIVEEDIPFSVIEMSKPHIEQVFFNLIHNAVKYSYTSTKQSEKYITVVCKSQKNFYCVEITNYGVGIKPEEISKGLIFKNGYRGELARDRSRTGSGFGLGRAKKIIEAHNGYLEVKSKQVGIGQKIDPHKTTVRVCIPLNQPKRSSHGNKKDIMD